MSIELERMTPSRAAYFMERFKREEKLLGPNEQAALTYVIDMLEKATAIQQAEAKTGEPVNPTHWRAVLSEPQRPHELRKHLHTVLFREWDDAESWVASKLDFEGWRYTLEPLYTHPAPGVPDGYVLVPIEPTKEMLAAGDAEDHWHTELIYAAMLTAAQAQKGGECLPIRGNQVTCSRGTGGCGIQHKGGD